MACVPPARHLLRAKNLADARCFERRGVDTLAEMGDFRWLTISPAGQEEYSIVLMAVPGEPVMPAVA